MCNLYTDRLGPDAIAAHFNVRNPLRTNAGGEVYPGTPGMVVREDSGERIGAFTIATARRNGEEVKLPTNAVMDAVIEVVSQGIESGEVTQASDLTVTLSAGEWMSLLNYIVKPYNFLKHADRDPSGAV